MDFVTDVCLLCSHDQALGGVCERFAYAATASQRDNLSLTEQDVWTPPFGRRTFGRWHMSELKPWFRAVSNPTSISLKNSFHHSNFYYFQEASFESTQYILNKNFLQFFTMNPTSVSSKQTPFSSVPQTRNKNALQTASF